MKIILVIALLLFISANAYTQPTSNYMIAKGRMPDVTKDKNNTIHVVYGSGDSIMYVSGNGKSFTSPSVVAVLPKLFASAMRGPQIAASYSGLIVTACTSDGNIYVYQQEGSGKWTKGVRINDAPETAKEALMDVSADGLHCFAVWLSAKSSKGQILMGAASVDGRKTWSQNKLVYSSLDSTVCECCKPSAVVQGNHVYVMFRNWLGSNRDLYLIQSVDNGTTFNGAKKLGAGSWKLNGCPMDGGGLAVTKTGKIQTVWRREETIYTVTPGGMENKIGEGKGCTLEIINGKNVYAWTASGEVILLKPQGQKIVLGKGSQPVLKALDDVHVVCVWENEKQIYSSVVEL